MLHAVGGWLPPVLAFVEYREQVLGAFENGLGPGKTASVGVMLQLSDILRSAPVSGGRTGLAMRFFVVKGWQV